MVDGVNRIGKSIDDTGYWITDGGSVSTRVWAMPVDESGHMFDIFYMDGSFLPDGKFYVKVGDGVRAENVSRYMQNMLKRKLDRLSSQKHEGDNFRDYG